ncbi:hypothetical protein GHO45_26455 [Pseudomonas sp. FSL R10-0765]|uniref:hypothetical protein n=1 Tax=Pseudomonas sp. FSL R10-0765 TaxID=2662195 RepID=UPI0012956F63|nr:hypothetical protein [Pseudomonas sp. FSL R10-0765]MQT44453.1 hypothetical protein [Pseudomonas sp. FSL R10-0765]
MSNFKALPELSQSGDNVLYFDSEASPSELYECAANRLEIARHMLQILSTSQLKGNEHALPAVASAAALLLSDANGMFESLYDVVREHEKLVQDVSAMEALAFVQ